MENFRLNLRMSKWRQVALLVTFVSSFTTRALAQERIYFPSHENAEAQIVARINAETVRLDIGSWLLNDGAILNAILNRHAAHVPIRILGDRASIFESDPNTRASFEKLANAGVPIRLRYNPRDFPEIMHWKCGIFVGQGQASLGSGNWTSFELNPVSTTNFKDETVMITDDASMVQALMTKFDQFWADTTYFMDWPDAYKRETGVTWTGTNPMTVDRTRLVVPDYPTNNFIWGQGIGTHGSDGPNIIPTMINEINLENTAIDMVSYRLTVPTVTDALVNKKKAGVPVRVFVEPTQYRNAGFPEYWLVGNETDKLWVAGIPIKIRTHDGITHMKTLITSRTALLASSNYTKNWQRDHNYYITAAAKPALYLSMKDEFERMWNDTANYEDFYPLKPNAPGLSAPATGAIDVSTLPKLEWKQTPWAVTFDVYLGTSTSNMTKVARVNATLTENPPSKYSYTVTQALQPSTKYFWKVVSRTFATDVDPTLIATSSTFSFTTGAGTGGGGGSGPYTGSPVALPGTIQAENFDKGGSGVAYNDTTSSNQGGQYRTTEAVDIEATSDTGGGYDIGWTAAGEWLNYTVNVATAGTYTIEARVAASGAGGTFHIEANGVDKTGPMTIPNTGGWQTWTTISKANVTLSAGAQIWRLVIDNAGSVVGNINYIRVSSGGGGPVTSTPYGGTPAPVPGTIQAENFDDGGSGVAYVDNSPTNQGGKYRTDTAVDIETTTDVGGGYDVGYMAPGEWMNYTVNVTTAGTYDIEFRVASSGGGGTFHLEIDGVNVSGPVSVPNTGGWQSWTTVKKTGVNLNAGSQVWRFVADSAGGTGAFANLNYIRVAAPSGGGGGGPEPFGGTPTALPSMKLEFENFDEGGPDVAYVDTTIGNSGGKYRATDVDIESTPAGGYDVGWVSAGEWLRYTVVVSTAGTYDLDIRVGSAGVGGTFHIEVDGVDKTGSISVPNTGGWQTWQTIRVSGVTLAAGTQVWRVVMDTNGSNTTAVGNFNWLQATLR
jgi:phosphatidylserine/phosphatidylglycerophosphate/cardiolipin synthase-like enzyme